jgi:hypothetical protein
MQCTFGPGNENDSALTWSPDSQNIVFRSTRSGTSQLWRVKADCTGLTQLTDLTGEAFDPAWSPDGSTIAFTSEGDLRLMDPDGANVRTLPGPGWEARPTWSPYSTKLAYVSWRDGEEGEIYSKKIDNSDERNLSDDPAADWDPAWMNVGFVNTPPALSGLPNQIFDHTTGPTSTIDLWAYGWDAQTLAHGLTYTIEGTPPSAAGVTLTDNRTVHVEPSTAWCGYTDVTIRATDPGGLWDEDTFRVAVTWSCQGPLPVPGQAAAQNEPIILDLTPYEPQVGDGTGMYWYVTGEDHCTVSGEYSEDDVLTFTPEAGFLGSDEVMLHMVYPWGGEAGQEVMLTWGTRLYLPVVTREYP